MKQRKVGDSILTSEKAASGPVGIWFSIVTNSFRTGCALVEVIKSIILSIIPTGPPIPITSCCRLCSVFFLVVLLIPIIPRTEITRMCSGWGLPSTGTRSFGLLWKLLIVSVALAFVSLPVVGLPADSTFLRELLHLLWRQCHDTFHYPPCLLSNLCCFCSDNSDRFIHLGVVTPLSDLLEILYPFILLQSHRMIDSN